jgi:NitT/TauT family transport system substrate-binding protein
MRSADKFRLLAAVCLLATGSAGAESPVPMTTIRVGYSNVSGFTGLFVAKSEGMFAKRGLDVQPVLIALNSTMPSALVGGSLQIACPSPPVFLQAIEGGLDIVVIAGGTANDWSKASGQGVVARTGVVIKSARDFEGKRVGAPGIGSYMQVLFRRWLVSKGANDKKVRFVEVPFAQGSDILKTGNVDALLTSDPFYSRIIQAKTGYLVSHYLQEMPEGLFSLYYSANRDWAEKNPELVRAYRAALDEANAFVTREPVKSREILAAALKFPPDVAANIVITHLDTNVTQADIKYWIDTLVDQGVMRTHPDPSKLLFN